MVSDQHHADRRSKSNIDVIFRDKGPGFFIKSLRIVSKKSMFLSVHPPIGKHMIKRLFKMPYMWSARKWWASGVYTYTYAMQLIQLSNVHTSVYTYIACIHVHWWHILGPWVLSYTKIGPIPHFQTLQAAEPDVVPGLGPCQATAWCQASWMLCVQPIWNLCDRGE